MRDMPGGMSLVISGGPCSMIGATLDVWNDPLLAALARERAGGVDDVSRASAADVAWRLLEQETEAALVNPLVVGRNEAELSLIPGCGIFAVGPTADTLLIFNPGLHHFTTLAVPSIEDPDAMLATVVLSEKYDMKPRLHAFHGDLDSALALFDAVLITGPAARSTDLAGRAMLDIVDEWFDMTQLPFPRAVFAAWDHVMTIRAAEECARAAAAADAIALEEMQTRMSEVLGADALHLIPGHYRYVLDEEALEGIDTFMRMAFFHGLTPGIPMLRLWEPPDAAADS